MTGSGFETQMQYVLEWDCGVLSTKQLRWNQWLIISYYVIEQTESNELNQVEFGAENELCVLQPKFGIKLFARTCSSQLLKY